MIENIDLYFGEEKAESLLFMIVGAIAILLSLYFIISKKKALLQGLAIPLISIGLIQVTVGSSVYFRTDAQAAALKQQVSEAPLNYVTEELPRMQTVNRWFDVYKIIEIFLAIIGLNLYLILRNSPKQYLVGVGIGLLLQSLLMLGLDLFAEKRADIYTMQIVQFGDDHAPS